MTRLSIVISWMLIAALVVPPGTAEAANAIPISAPSAVLLDASNHKIIFSKTPHQKRAPASTTKLLTAIIAVEQLKLDSIITIPQFAESIEPSKAHLKAGERYYVKDLIRAALISSANDAAEVLGWAVAGSRSRFSKLMNQKAKQVGAKRSHFIRASGLPAEGQYSTAYDLARIVRYAERYPFIVKTMKIKKTAIRSLAGRTIYLKNHNKMLWKDPRDIIGKTGWTKRARHCFVGQIESRGKKMFVAIMGSQRLWQDLKMIMDYEFGASWIKISKNKKIWGRREAVRIQTALKYAGYNPGVIDGKFGPKTVHAIEKFQQSHHLHVDGIVGKKTWGMLKRYL